MFRIILLTIFIILSQGCATWKGVKQDSKQAWQATKDTSSEAYDGVKKSIHDATAE